MAKQSDSSLTCFVMMPFAGEFDDIYRHVIKPAVEESGFRSVRADELSGAGPIFREIIQLIASADLLVVDVSRANPNVYYELGIAHSLARRVIIITSDIQDVPFDLRHYRALVYDKQDPFFGETFRATLRQAIKHPSETPAEGSPVVEALPATDTVPRSDLQTCQKTVNELQGSLALREEEISALKSATPGAAVPELAAIREDITAHLKKVTDDLISRSGETLIETKVQLEIVRQENDALRSAEREVRRLKQMTLVNPHWKGRDFDLDEELCFLVMPFVETWSNSVWKLIDTIVSKAGFKCKRADEQDGRLVMDDLWESLCKAKIVIADLTARNPNVTYEVGMADVLGKGVILLSQTPDDIPFDFLGLRLITYQNSIEGAQELEDKLIKRIGGVE